MEIQQLFVTKSRFGRFEDLLNGNLVTNSCGIAIQPITLNLPNDNSVTNSRQISIQLITLKLKWNLNYSECTCQQETTQCLFQV